MTSTDHILWFNISFSKSDDEIEATENGESEKLNLESKTRDISTSMSLERLSLMIKYNQIGSLSSLSRSKVRKKVFFGVLNSKVV